VFLKNTQTLIRKHLSDALNFVKITNNPFEFFEFKQKPLNLQAATHNPLL